MLADLPEVFQLLDTIISRGSVSVNSADVQTFAEKWWEQLSLPVQYVAFLLSSLLLVQYLSHLFIVPSEHSPASGTNRWYASPLVRGITSLSSSGYCGTCSNGSLFPQRAFFLSLPLGSRKFVLENEIPVLFLQIGNLAHKLTFYNSVSGMEIWEWSYLV